MQLAGNIVVTIAAVLGWIFVVQYHLSAPWWRSEMGRHMMTYSAVVAAVLTLSVVRIVGGAGLDTPWFVLLRLIVFCGVPVAIGWRIVILWRAQRRDGRHGK